MFVVAVETPTEVIARKAAEAATIAVERASALRVVAIRAAKAAKQAADVAREAEASAYDDGDTSVSYARAYDAEVAARMASSARASLNAAIDDAAVAVRNAQAAADDRDRADAAGAAAA